MSNLRCSNKPTRRFGYSTGGSPQRGATLIEILVAVIILSFGMLGIAAMQTRALQGNQSSLQRSQAIILNNSLIDAMRIDRNRAIAGDYNMVRTNGASSIGTGTLAKANLTDWLTVAETVIGNTTHGTVNCAALTQVCTVVLDWDDTKAGGLSDQSVTITAKL